FLELLNRRDVDDPDRTAERTDDELAVARLNRQRSHRRMRQVSLPARPVAAAVDRGEEARLRADEQYPRVVWIFADHIRRSPRRQVRGDHRPRLAEIGRLEEIGPRIVAIVEIERDIYGAG